MSIFYVCAMKAYYSGVWPAYFLRQLAVETYFRPETPFSSRRRNCLYASVHMRYSACNACIRVPLSPETATWCYLI